MDRYLVPFFSIRVYLISVNFKYFLHFKSPSKNINKKLMKNFYDHFYIKKGQIYSEN